MWFFPFFDFPPTHRLSPPHTLRSPSVHLFSPHLMAPEALMAGVHASIQAMENRMEQALTEQASALAKAIENLNVGKIPAQQRTFAQETRTEPAQGNTHPQGRPPKQDRTQQNPPPIALPEPTLIQEVEQRSTTKPTPWQPALTSPWKRFARQTRHQSELSVGRIADTKSCSNSTMLSTLSRQRRKAANGCHSLTLNSRSKSSCKSSWCTAYQHLLTLKKSPPSRTCKKKPRAARLTSFSQVG